MIAARFRSALVEAIEASWFDEPWGLASGQILPNGAPAYRLKIRRAGCTKWQKFLAKERLKRPEMSDVYAAASSRLLAERAFRGNQTGGMTDEQSIERWGELVQQINQESAARIEGADLETWKRGLGNMIEEWDLTRENGEPIPLTFKSVMEELFANAEGAVLPLKVPNPECFSDQFEWSATQAEDTELFRTAQEVIDRHPSLKDQAKLFQNLVATPEPVSGFDFEGLRIEYRPKTLIVPYGGHAFGDANALWLMDCIVRAEDIWRKSLEEAEGN